MENNSNESFVDLGRLNALSDGVFAVALTLLVLDIRIPENVLPENLGNVLLGLAPKLVIYLISFIVIGGAWGSHQRMLSQIKQGDGLLVWFNLLALLFITLLPASALLLGRFPDELIAIVCFAVDVILIQLAVLWLWRHSSKHDLIKSSLDPLVIRGIGRRLTLSAIGFGLSVALAVLSTKLVYVGWIGLSIFVFTTDWLSWRQVVKTTQIAIPLDGAEHGQIEVLHGAGNLKIFSGAPTKMLMQGTCRGNVDSQITRKDELLKNQLVLRPDKGFMNWRRYPWAWELPSLDWNLRLNPRIPLELSIQKGSGETDLDLTKTHLTELRLVTGTGFINLRLPANAGQSTVHVEAANVSVEIYVPVGVAALIHAVEQQTSLEVDPTRFPSVADGNEYRSSNYDTAANRVEIHLERVTGSVRII